MNTTINDWHKFISENCNRNREEKKNIRHLLVGLFSIYFTLHKILMVLDLDPFFIIPPSFFFFVVEMNLSQFSFWTINFGFIRFRTCEFRNNVFVIHCIPNARNTKDFRMEEEEKENIKNPWKSEAVRFVSSNSVCHQMSFHWQQWAICDMRYVYRWILLYYSFFLMLNNMTYIDGFTLTMLFSNDERSIPMGNTATKSKTSPNTKYTTITTFLYRIPTIFMKMIKKNGNKI